MSTAPGTPADPGDSDAPGSARSATDDAAAPVTKGRLAADILLYTLARLAIVVVVAAIIVGGGALVGVTVPLLVAAIFGVLIAMPVSMFVLGGMRRRLNAAIAGFDAQRRADREALHARLRGDSK